MNRRAFVSSLGVAAAGACASAPESEADVPRPNVVYLFSDQHRRCSLPWQPDCEVIAPNMERLRREGAVFPHSVSNYPLCSPARGIWISGRWPHQTGVTANGITLAPSENSIGNVFRRAGYHTGYVGKWHLGNAAWVPEERGGSPFIPTGEGRHGFEDFHIWTNTNAHWESNYVHPDTGEVERREGYNATLMTDQALAYLDERADSADPFALFVSWNPPHPPLHDAPPELLKLYSQDGLSIRSNVAQDVREGKKRFSTHGGHNDVLQTMREQLAHYYAHVPGVDREIGRVLDKLDELGVADNTIVIYSSDHGDMLASHNRLRKPHPYAESTDTPLLIRYPKSVPAGGEIGGMASMVDHYPTMLGLAGIPVPADAVGLDLSALCRGKDAAEPDTAFILASQTSLGIDPALERLDFLDGTRGVVTERYAYMRTGEKHNELFDLEEDPFQMRNLYNDAGYAKLRRDLHLALGEWVEKSGDPRQWTPLGA